MMGRESDGRAVMIKVISNNFKISQVRYRPQTRCKNRTAHRLASSMVNGVPIGVNCQFIPTVLSLKQVSFVAEPFTTAVLIGPVNMVMAPTVSAYGSKIY